MTSRWLASSQHYLHYNIVTRYVKILGENPWRKYWLNLVIRTEPGDAFTLFLNLSRYECMVLTRTRTESMGTGITTSMKWRASLTCIHSTLRWKYSELWARILKAECHGSCWGRTGSDVSRCITSRSIAASPLTNVSLGIVWPCTIHISCILFWKQLNRFTIRICRKPINVNYSWRIIS